MKSVKAVLAVLLALALLGLGAGLPYLAGLLQEASLENAVEIESVPQIQLTSPAFTLMERIYIGMLGSSQSDVDTSLARMTEEDVREAAEDILSAFAGLEELDFLLQDHVIMDLSPNISFNLNGSAFFWYVNIQAQDSYLWDFTMVIDDATGKAIGLSLDIYDTLLLFQSHGYDYNDETILDLLYRLSAEFFGQLGIGPTYTLRTSGTPEEGIEVITTPMEDLGQDGLVYRFYVYRTAIIISPDTYFAPTPKATDPASGEAGDTGETASG